MSVINFPANSPYYATPQYNWYTGNFVFRPIPPNGGDTTIILGIDYQYRPDKLSFDLYQTPAYWWIFCIRNPFLRPDPIWNFVAGITIFVPTSDYLGRILGS